MPSRQRAAVFSGALRAHRDGLRRGAPVGAGAREIRAVDEGVAVVVDAVHAEREGGLGLVLRGHAAHAAHAAVAVLAVDEAVAVVVAAVGAERRGVLDARGDVAPVAAAEVGAVDEAVAVVVDAVGAARVVELPRAAQLHDGLAPAVAAVELPVAVVVDAVAAGEEAVLGRARRQHRDALGAHRAELQAVVVFAVDEPVAVVVVGVGAGLVVGLVAEHGLRRRVPAVGEARAHQQRQGRAPQGLRSLSAHRGTSPGASRSGC